jgi:acetyltransferase-like isoleucine patch superfamily enzyme
LTKLDSHFKQKLKLWASIGIIPFPSRLKIPIYRWVFGYKIGKHVKIGLSWIHVGKLEIGDHVIIRHLVRFKNLPEVKIGHHCAFGFGTTFTSAPEFIDPGGLKARGNRPMLTVGDHCGITMLHYFDVQDALIIGDFTTIAGRGSVFFTHYLDLITGKQSCKPISVGRYCMIGSNARFAPGSSVPDYCAVGMGAVVTKQFPETHCLIGGNPAAVIRKLPEDAVYFKRTVGWISSVVPAPMDRTGKKP